ncbi:sel1 repeat family protein [Pseudomonas guariconensis]|uniref:sel1 repeat family protein n=1 Tax=Pseudomonas guariconensis TaxID=1288410 RepID=UPI00390584A5
MAVIKGEKQKAWDILFPEAKAGNVVAMYHLGTLMLHSPEYPDNLVRAGKFFKAAADRGHKGSAAMLAQVRNMQSLKGTVPTIAGRSGLPVSSDLERAKQALADMQASIGRYVQPPPSTTPSATVRMFISENSAAVSDLVDVETQAKARFGDKVDFQYFVVIDPSNWDPRRVFTPPKNPEIRGFHPDLNGEEARKYGVTTTPAIVMTGPNGQRKFLASSQTVISELSAALR